MSALMTCLGVAIATKVDVLTMFEQGTINLRLQRVLLVHWNCPEV